jgi:hypothetical protein
VHEVVCFYENCVGSARNNDSSICLCIYSDIVMAEGEEGKEYRWETGYEKTW